MPSETHAALPYAPMGPPRWWSRRRKIIAITLLVLGLLLACGTYFACFHTYRLTVDQAGWTLQFSFRPFRCLHCTGRIEKLRYRGKPLQLPALPGADIYRMLYVWTPVGTFEWYGDIQWLAIMSPGRQMLSPKLAPLTEADLAQGYYDLLLSEHTWEEIRSGRQGTPPHWYLLESGDLGRWIDPHRMGQITGWPTTQPIATTKPAAAQLILVEHGQP